MGVLSKIVAAAAALLVVVGLASSAASPAAAPASAGAAISQHASARLPQSASAELPDWTGYVDKACSTCHIRYVNANFKVPTLNCANSNMGSGGAWMSLWVGLDGDGDSTVEQVGIQARCTSFANSSARYFAFYEMVPNGYVTIPVPVSPGNSISVSTYYNQSSNDYQLNFQNNTTLTGEIAIATCPTTCDNKTAEVIAEDVGGGPPTYDMPNFGSVSFSSTTVTSYDGTHGDLCRGSLWSSGKVQSVDYLGNTLATAGSLNTCSGPDGFTVTYRQSQ